jgi:hypothetical protein
VSGAHGYRRLPGKGRSLVSWHTLWLGEDHLLAVQTSGYHESYRRYYFKDIQAIVSCRTTRGRNWSIVLALLLLLTAGGALATRSADMGGVWLVPGICLLAALVSNLYLGPTCVAVLQMPLAGYELPSIRRLRTAQRLRDRIHPFIAATQGEMTAELANRSFAPAVQESVPLRPEPIAPLAPAPGSPDAPRYGGRPHRLLFGLLLVDALYTSFQVFYQTGVLAVVNSLMILAQFGLIITALVKQSSHPLPRAVRRLTWVALANLLVSLMAFSIYSFIHFFTAAMTTGTPPPSGTLPTLRIPDHPFLMGVAMVNVVVSVVCGVAGLAALSRRGPPVSPGRGESRHG